MGDNKKHEPTKNFPEEDMQKALNEIRNERMLLREAPKQFKVPLSRLGDNQHRKYSSTKAGEKTELTEEEEASLVWYNGYMPKINYSLPIEALKPFAWNIVKKSNGLNKFSPETGSGKTWYLKFKKRHRLTNRSTHATDRGRNKVANINVYNQHFDLL